MPGVFKFPILALLCSLVTPDKTGVFGEHRPLLAASGHCTGFPLTLSPFLPSSTPTRASMEPSLAASLAASRCGCALYCVVRRKEQQEPEKDECGEGICLCPLIFFPLLATFTALLLSVLCGHRRRDTSI